MWQKPTQTYDAAGNMTEHFYDATICVPGEKGCIAFPTFVRGSPQCGEGRIIVGEKIDGDLYFAEFNPNTNINDMALNGSLPGSLPVGVHTIDGDKLKANDKEIVAEHKQRVVEAEAKYRRYKDVVRWDGDDTKVRSEDALDPKKNPFAVPVAKPQVPQGMDSMAFYCVDPNNISRASERPTLYRPKPHKWRESEHYCPANEMGYKGHCLKKYYYDAQQRQACENGKLEDGCRNFQTVTMHGREPTNFSDRSRYAIQAKSRNDSTFQHLKMYDDCIEATPDGKRCIQSRLITFYCPSPRHVLQMNYEQRKVYCMDPYTRNDQSAAQSYAIPGYVPIHDHASGRVWYCPNAGDIIVTDGGYTTCANAATYDRYMNAFPMNRCQKAYNADCMLGHTLPMNDDHEVEWDKLAPQK